MKTFEEIYTENYQLVYNHINMRVNKPEISEELTNDTFMRVLKHLSSFDSTRSTMQTWVTKIASNLVLDHFRCNRYANNRISATDFENSDKGVSEYDFLADDSADGELENSELNQKIMGSFRSLKPKYRRVAVLYFMNQKSYKEVAETLDVPMGTVFGMISRCRAMLQTNLTAQAVR